MSAKTYAGLNRSAKSVHNKVLNAEGFSIIPSKDMVDESVFRSRLGARSEGSGPWFVARRVVDPATPSTDGFGNLSVYSVPGGQYGMSKVDYKLFVQLSYSITDRTYTSYNWYYDARITRYHYFVRPSTSVYYITCDELFVRSRKYKKDQRCQLGFNQEDIFRCYFDGNFSKASQILNSVLGNPKADVGEILQERYNYTYQQSRRYVWDVTVDLAPPEAVYLEYLQDAEMYCLTGILPGSWAMGWETAFIEAGKNLPQAATNVAANVLEAASMLKSLLTGDILGELPKNAREAWLAYRYAYTTTKLDVREFKTTFDRLDSLMHAQRVSTYGSYVRDGIQFRVGYEIDTTQIIPRDVSTTLRKFGLELSALNVWDMIPYSFVVDWFLPVSDVIDYFESMDACKIEPKDLWWSLTTVKDGYLIYVRLPGRKLSTMPYLQLSSAGSKTIALRIADAVALFAP